MSVKTDLKGRAPKTGIISSDATYAAAENRGRSCATRPRLFCAGDRRLEPFVNLLRSGDRLPDGRRHGFVAGDDFDGADGDELFGGRGNDAGANDFAQGTIEKIDGEYAGDAEDALVGEDVNAAHPLQHGPHEPADDDEKGGLEEEMIVHAAVGQGQGRGDDGGGNREGQGIEDDEPERGLEDHQDQFAVAEDVRAEQGAEGSGSCGADGGGGGGFGQVFAGGCRGWRGRGIHGVGSCPFNVTMSGRLR